MRLFQLVSPALPVGGFSFSHGLEYAVEAGWVKTEEEVSQWVATVMRESLGRVDLPILFRAINALQQNDVTTFSYWNDYCLANRESAEFYLADTEMGKALLRLLKQLHPADNHLIDGDVSFVLAFAVAAQRWGITQDDAMAGFLWSWLENQVTAATKIVPFGQSVAQRMLWQLSEAVNPILLKATKLRDQQLGGGLPRLAIASALHETQYTRLYRS